MECYKDASKHCDIKWEPDTRNHKYWKGNRNEAQLRNHPIIGGVPGGLMIKQSAAGAKVPRFNSPVTRAHLRFNSRMATRAGKQCWLCSVRMQQTVIV